MEEGQATFSRQELLQQSENGRGSKFLWLLVPVVIAVLIGGGIYFFRLREKNEEVDILTPTPTLTSVATMTPTLTPLPTPTPTPQGKATPTPTKKLTPTPIPQRSATTAAELKRQAISVQVLNGSGVVGSAKKLADYLASLSYAIAATGNASSFDFEQTVIQTKKESDLELLKGDLAAQYEIGSASATLSSSSSYDAVVTVGKK